MKVSIFRARKPWIILTITVGIFALAPTMATSTKGWLVHRECEQGFQVFMESQKNGDALEYKKELVKICEDVSRRVD